MVNIENKPELKSRKGYLFIIYCLIVSFVWPVGLFCLAFKGNMQYINLYILVMAPFAFIAALMLFNLSIFPFKYSIFGSYKRRPFPNEKPLLKKTTSGRISLLQANGPFITYVVYQSGLGISILGTNVFIPTHYITDVNEHFLTGYKLKHNSPELRSSIIFYDKDIYEALRKLCDM